MMSQESAEQMQQKNLAMAEAIEGVRDVRAGLQRLNLLLDRLGYLARRSLHDVSMDCRADLNQQFQQFHHDLLGMLGEDRDCYEVAMAGCGEIRFRVEIGDLADTHLTAGERGALRILRDVRLAQRELANQMNQLDNYAWYLMEEYGPLLVSLESELFGDVTSGSVDSFGELTPLRKDQFKKQLDELHGLGADHLDSYSPSSRMYHLV
jgi:hypothetical protein